jgi:hypothetical protein
MTRKNLGARNAVKRSYSLEDMRIDADPKRFDTTLQGSVKRQTKQALDWAESRGANGDNIPTNALEDLHTAAQYGNTTDALEAAHTVLQTQMHPTAWDICGAPAKQLVYNLCGRRANKYRTDN